MMLFTLILLVFGISMAMMAIGYVLSDKPLERGCGKFASGPGHCGCRKAREVSNRCPNPRPPRSMKS